MNHARARLRVGRGNGRPARDSRVLTGGHDRRDVGLVQRPEATSPSSSLTARGARRTCRTPRAARCRSRRPSVRRRASRIGTSRFASPRAASRTRSSAASAAAASRSARTRRVRSTWRRSASGSRRCSSIPSLVVLGEAVDADDDALAGLDLALELVRRLLDLVLGEALLDRRDRAAELVDPRDQLQRALLELARQATRGSTRRRAGRPCPCRRPRAGGSAACAARCARCARSGARAPRRRRSCGSTAPRRRPPRAPGRRPGRRCSPAAARSGSSRPSARGSAAPAPSGSWRRSGRA